MKNQSESLEISVIWLILEILIISLVLISISYFFNKTDPFLINQEINLMLILVAVISLFYGFPGGISIIIIIGIGLKLLYSKFPSSYYINLVLFMLIFSEFNYYWNRKIKKYKARLDYSEKKLKELAYRFYTLKLSHDQMEKSYITKPKSIRNVLSEIKKLYLLNPQNAYDELFSIITKSYNIRKASLYIAEKKGFIKIKSLNTTSDLNLSSRIFNQAIEKKSPAYLSQYSDLRKDYLAVIPATDSEDNIKFIFILEDIPFFYFTKDTIFSIWVITSYFADYISGFEYAQDIIKQNPECPEDFLVEIKRMSYIYKKLGITTTILIIKIKDESINNDYILTDIEQNMRSMDIICHKKNTFFIIFPFSSYENVKTVIERIKNSIQKRFAIKDDDIKIIITNVKKNAEKTLSTLRDIINYDN